MTANSTSVSIYTEKLKDCMSWARMWTSCFIAAIVLCFPVKAEVSHEMLNHLLLIILNSLRCCEGTIQTKAVRNNKVRLCDNREN